jgi:hypothetical protein
VLLDITFIVDLEIALFDEYNKSDVPLEYAPNINGLSIVVDVTLITELRILDVLDVPEGNSTPIRLTFPDEDKFIVQFSIREFTPIDTKTVFTVTFDFWIIVH